MIRLKAWECVIKYCFEGEKLLHQYKHVGDCMCVCVCVLRILKKDKNIFVNNGKILSANFSKAVFNDVSFLYFYSYFYW